MRSDLMLNILFLCTGNSCRSQMAEGWGNFLKGNRYHFYSAGTLPQVLNPLAVNVMNEVGVDISTHYSKSIYNLKEVKFDIIFTVCGDANENCTFFPSRKVIHVGFDDPPRLARNLSDPEEVLNCYRKVRDEIKDFITDIEKWLILN